MENNVMPEARTAMPRNAITFMPSLDCFS